MISLPIGQPGAFILHGQQDLLPTLIAHGFTPATATPDLLLFAGPDHQLEAIAAILAAAPAPALAILLLGAAPNPQHWRAVTTHAATHAFIRASALAHASRDLRVNAIACTPQVPRAELAQTIALMLGLPSMTGQIIHLGQSA